MLDMTEIEDELALLDVPRRPGPWLAVPFALGALFWFCVWQVLK